MNRKLIKNIPFATYTLDESNRIIDINNTFESITGYNKGEIKKSNFYLMDLFPDNNKDLYLDKFNEVVTEKLLEHRIKNKNGSLMYVFSLITTSSNGYKTIKMFNLNSSIFLSTRENELQNKYEEIITNLENKAIYDDLTNLLRREPFIKKLNDYLEKKVPIAFFIIDVDKFKAINDTYGHNVGDEILIKVSNTFKEVIKEDGLICRLGGDEFAIFLPEIKNIEEIKLLAKKLLNNIRKIYLDEDKNYKVSVSIGATLIKNYNKAINFNYLYSTTDKELYKAKEEGKNRYSIHE